MGLPWLGASERRTLRGITVEKMLYDPREGLTGHGIWNPDRTDLRLLPELEARISEFIKM